MRTNLDNHTSIINDRQTVAEFRGSHRRGAPETPEIAHIIDDEIDIHDICWRIREHHPGGHGESAPPTPPGLPLGAIGV